MVGRAQLGSVAVIVGLCGCDCRAPRPAAADAGAPGERSPFAPAIRPWAMGVARLGGSVALPPPCTLRAEPFRAVVEREVRIVTEPVTLATVLGAEGATRDRFRREAAGLLTIHGDRASVDPAPWPEQGSVHVARAGADWLFAFGDRPSGAGVDRVMVVRGERQELLAAGRGLVAIDLRCDVRWCAILVDSPASGGTAWLGSVAEPAGAWQPLALPALAERPQHPLAVVRLPGADAEHPTGVVVAVADDVRLRFYALRVDRPPQEQSSLSAPHGVLAVSGGPRPAALVRAGDPGRDGCAATGAGALVARPEREAVALPGALPPTRGALHPIGDGAYLATWLAPDGCASARLLLFAAMVRADGTPAAPVTAVGDAADYAVAARGEDVDLWIAADRTVSYLPLDCRWLGPR